MTRISWLASVCAVAVFVTSAHANLLDDGSFTLATPGAQTSNSAWTLTTNFPDSIGSGAQFQGGFANAENGSGGPGDGGNGIWFKSFEGNQGGSGEPAVVADVTQSMIAPVSGDYTLNFVAGRESNFTADGFYVLLSSNGTGGSASVDLLTAPMVLGNIGGATSPALGGNPFSLTLSGVTAGDTLTVTGGIFGGVDSQIPGGQSAFLDQFSLTVPEPTSIMLAGLSVVGLLARRRRS